MNLSISMQVQLQPDNTPLSPVLVSAAIPEKDIEPVFAAGLLKRLDALVAQVVEDVVARANAASPAATVGVAEETQTAEAMLAEMPAPPPDETPADTSSQLTLLSF